jgi:hypothetical protein
MVRVPEEIEWCIYVRGESAPDFEAATVDELEAEREDEVGTALDDVAPSYSADDDKGAFVIQYLQGMELFRYEEIARDADGVFLVADNGETTRILGGEEMFEDAGDLALVRLEITMTNLEIVAQYDIRRVPDVSITYGA